jgi:alkyl sulfatase BDS1-like metallo-beta-lactamase superfamily hydrolase
VHGRDATHNLHNILTLRGAVVRDAHGWAGYLDEAIALFAEKADVLFAQHHWPRWGRERMVDFLATQRDLYGYIHDQTVRLLTRASSAARSPNSSSCRRAWSASGTAAATTGR